MATEVAYVPGVCNINRAEIAYRRKWAYIGLASFAVLTALLFIIGVNRFVRLVVFLPAFIGVIGVLQTKNKFCVTYGAAGQQNATEGSTTAHDVTDKTAKAKDKAKARKMNSQAAIISVVATLLVVLI